MANLYGPRIVTDGLVLCLDAGNSKSYPGSGTSWFDLSGSSNNGTLENGPTYSSANYGGIVFDGTNDRVNCTTAASIFNNFAYDVWCKPAATHEIDTETNHAFNTSGLSGQKYLIGPNYVASPDAGAGISVGTNGISVYEHSDGYIAPLLVYQTTINSIINIIINYTNKQPSLYINGSFIKNGLTSVKSNVKITTRSIGGDSSSYGFFNGTVYNARFYNKSLSITEILQNYRATKGRYNL